MAPSPSEIGGSPAPDEGNERRERYAVLVRTLEECDAFRFAVGSDEAGYSSIWRAWAHGRDYYVAVRRLGGSLKVSLHPPKPGHPDHIGKLAMTREYYFEYLKRHPHLGAPPQGPAFTTWRRPPPPEVGAHAAMVAVFPTNHLRSTKAVGTERKPLIVFEPAPRDHAVEVWFFHSCEPMDSLEARLCTFGKPIIATKLSGGSTFSIVARHRPFDYSALPPEEKIKASRPTWLDTTPRPPAGTQVSNLNALFLNCPGDGEALRVIELGGVSITVWE